MVDDFFKIRFYVFLNLKSNLCFIDKTRINKKIK